jgi:hypothetical protein
MNVNVGPNAPCGRPWGLIDRRSYRARKMNQSFTRSRHLNDMSDDAPTPGWSEHEDGGSMGDVCGAKNGPMDIHIIRVADVVGVVSGSPRHRLVEAAGRGSSRAGRAMGRLQQGDEFETQSRDSDGMPVTTTLGIVSHVVSIRNVRENREFELFVDLCGGAPPGAWTLTGGASGSSPSMRLVLETRSGNYESPGGTVLARTAGEVWMSERLSHTHDWGVDDLRVV